MMLKETKSLFTCRLHQCCVGLFALVGVLLPGWSWGCGLNWSPPESHFERVGSQGNVLLAEELGEVDAGEGLKLPLRAIFRSDNNRTSPYTGYGWDIPLLESYFVQLDDSFFRLVEPTGWYRTFWRDKKDPSILHGQGGWKGEIRGDRITAWATCGSKLVFNKGLIIEMQLKDRKFDYVYENGRVDQIKEGNTVLLQVEKEQIGGKVKGLTLVDKQKIRFEKGTRPQVQVIGGQNLVGGMSPSLSKVVKADGSEKKFEFAVDKKLNPTLTIDEDRLIVWDAATRKVIRDGEWTYDVKPGEGFFANAAIGRENAKNQSEFWHYNGAKGEETVLGIDGVKRVKTWFTSGKLGSVDTIESILL